MASKYWIKLYHEILDDYKMGMLPDRLYRRVIELFLFAGEFESEGELPKVEAMAWRLRMQPEELLRDLEALQEKEIVMLHNGKWIVTKFAERQAPVSDAERMRRLRERKQKEQYYGDEPVTDSVTKRNVDTDTDTDTDTDENRLDDAKSDFSEYQKVWEQETGKPIAGFTQFYRMCEAFVAAGVTPNIYRTAIQEQSNSNYAVSNPTSVKNWAIGLLKKKDTNTSTQDATDLIMEMVAKGEI
jgi:hypothetical protein